MKVNIKHNFLERHHIPTQESPPSTAADIVQQISRSVDETAHRLNLVISLLTKGFHAGQ